MRRMAFGVVMAAVSFSSRSQDSQFTFDPNGNLLIESSLVAAPPRILSQPRPQVVGPGELASFFVVSADSQALAYQWLFNGANITGATDETLLVRNVRATNEGAYSVTLMNASGSVTSAPAVLWWDGDGDGLPDSWEQSHFTNLTQNPTGDFDRDGVSNRDEFLDDSDPTDKSSVRFRLTILTDGGRVEASPAGKSYTNGEVVTLTAVASGSERFRGWTGDVLSGSNSITVTMTNHKSLFAYFNPVTLVWAAQANGDWETPANWRPSLVPGDRDTIVINVGRTVSVNGPSECAHLILGSATAIPVLSGSGTLTVTGTFDWLNGVVRGNGRTIIAPGATLNIPGPADLFLFERTLENRGTILWTGGNLGAGNATISNAPGALFEVGHAAGLNFTAQQGSRFDNAGTFRKSLSAGTTTIFGGMTFNNSGRVEIGAGTLHLLGGGTSSGVFDVPAGTTLNLGGNQNLSVGSSITGQGNLTVSSGPTITLAGLVNVSGTHTFSGGTVNLTGNYISTNNTVLISGGVANFNGTGIVLPAVLNLSGSGTLSGTGTVTITSLMNWAGGVMSGSGRTIISPGATLNIPGPSDVFLSTRRLENDGTILWTGGNFGVSAAVITNRTGALFETRHAGTLNHALQSGSRFDNAGIFRKSLSAGTTTIFNGMVFNNLNRVEIASGILTVNGGYGSSSNALLHCAIGGTTVGTGYGRLQVAGTVNLNGALSVDLINGFIPAINDSFAVLTAGTRNGTFSSFFYPSNAVTMQLSNSLNSVIVHVNDVLVIPQPMFLPPEVSGLDIRLMWTAISNTTYRIEFKSDLNSTNWDALPGNVTSLSNVASKVDVLAPTNRFYRLRTIP